MYDDILFPTDGSDGAAAALDHAADIAETYGATLHVLYVIDTTYRHSGMVGDAYPAVDPTLMSGEEDAGDDEEDGPSGDAYPTIDPTLMTGDRDDDADEPQLTDDALEATAESVVEDVVAELPDGVETVPVVEYGDPYQTIRDYTGSNGIDLVVMGTHGRTGIERYLLGSVAEKVVRTSEVPVLTVRIDE